MVEGTIRTTTTIEVVEEHRMTVPVPHAEVVKAIGAMRAVLDGDVADDAITVDARDDEIVIRHVAERRDRPENVLADLRHRLLIADRRADGMMQTLMPTTATYSALQDIRTELERIRALFGLETS